MSVPKWSINGVSSVPPTSPYAGKKRSSKIISEETNARKAENDLYPYLQSPSYGPSVIPLSPDPFRRFTSDSNDQHNNASMEPLLVTHPSPRKSSLSGFSQFENVASMPSSRFSVDSTLSETGAAASQAPQKGPPRGSSMVSVKSIRKLWRKSTKGSVSAPLPSGSNSASGKISPQPPPPPPPRLPVSKEVPAPPQSPSFSEMLPPPTPSLPSLPPSRAVSRADSSTDHSRDQETRYPLRYTSISPTPQLVASLALASRAESPSVPPLHNPPLDKNGGGRKSILKTWKSTSGSFSQNYDSSRSTPDHNHGDLSMSATVTRKRRPSVFDSASSLMRGSAASLVYDVPPSPSIPDHFSNNPSPQFKNNMSSTRLTRQAPAGSFSSTDSSPPIVSPLTTTSPRHGAAIIQRTSGESYRSRPSLDNSQFEIVSPKLNSLGMRSSLSYPYNELDH
jgi:hypothetical protein